MANVLLGLTVEDGEGKRKNVVLYMNPADISTLAAATTIANAGVAALDNVITGGVVEAYVKFPITLAAPTTPAAESRVGTGGNLTFLDAIGNQYSVYIPSMSNSKVINGLVNIDDPDIEALGELFVVTTGVRTPHQHDLTALIGGKQVN